MQTLKNGVNKLAIENATFIPAMIYAKTCVQKAFNYEGIKQLDTTTYKMIFICRELGT